MKKIILILTLLNTFLSFSQNSTILPQGIYKTYNDFMNKKVIKYNEPFNIKMPFGAFYYSLKDSTNTKLKTPYFAIVQNDSILVRVKDLKERFKSNKDVIIKSGEFEYNLALYNNSNEIYFEQIVCSKSAKYIGFNIGYPKGVVFNLSTNRSYIFMEYDDVKSYLKSIGKINLLEHLTPKKKIDAREVAKLIKMHLEIN